MFRPFSFLLTFAFRRILSITLGGNFNPNMIQLFGILYTVTNTLYKAIGIFPTLRFLRIIRQIITNPASITNISNIIEGVLGATRLTIIHIVQIVKQCNLLLEECVKLP